jgi:hypothetical protein
MLTIKYRRAYLYYVANKFEEAATLFRDVAHSDPATPDPENLREISADLYLDALNVMGDMWNPQRPACFDAMGEDAARSSWALLQRHARPQHEDFCGRMASCSARCSARRPRRSAHAGRFAEAAREYVSIVRTHRECGRLDEMLYNAAIEYDAAFLLGRVDARARAPRADLPPAQQPWAQRALYRLAGNYHAIQVFGRAAELYEQYAEYVNNAPPEAVARPRPRTARPAHARWRIRWRRPRTRSARRPSSASASARRTARCRTRRSSRATSAATRQRRRVAANVVFSIGQIYTDRVARLRRTASDVDLRASAARATPADPQAWNDLMRHYAGFMRTYAAQGTARPEDPGRRRPRARLLEHQNFRQASVLPAGRDAWGRRAPAEGPRRPRRASGRSASSSATRPATRSSAARRPWPRRASTSPRCSTSASMARAAAVLRGGNRRAFDQWTERSLTPYIQNRAALLDAASGQVHRGGEHARAELGDRRRSRLADMYYQFAQTSARAVRRTSSATRPARRLQRGARRGHAALHEHGHGGLPALHPHRDAGALVQRVVAALRA